MQIVTESLPNKWNFRLKPETAFYLTYCRERAGNKTIPYPYRWNVFIFKRYTCLHWLHDILVSRATGRPRAWLTPPMEQTSRVAMSDNTSSTPTKLRPNSGWFSSNLTIFLNKRRNPNTFRVQCISITEDPGQGRKTNHFMYDIKFNGILIGRMYINCNK